MCNARWAKTGSTGAPDRMRRAKVQRQQKNGEKND